MCLCLARRLAWVHDHHHRHHARRRPMPRPAAMDPTGSQSARDPRCRDPRQACRANTSETAPLAVIVSGLRIAEVMQQLADIQAKHHEARSGVATVTDGRSGANNARSAELARPMHVVGTRSTGAGQQMRRPEPQTEHKNDRAGANADDRPKQEPAAQWGSGCVDQNCEAAEQSIAQWDLVRVERNPEWPMTILSACH